MQRNEGTVRGDPDWIKGDVDSQNCGAVRRRDGVCAAPRDWNESAKRIEMTLRAGKGRDDLDEGGCVYGPDDDATRDCSRCLWRMHRYMRRYVSLSRSSVLGRPAVYGGLPVKA